MCKELTVADISSHQIEFTKLPGALDCGMNIIYVVEKSPFVEETEVRI